ncbi:unnamed protein product [Protopolystoma xenopodis]|uniref:Uncharacterized protein n=1 Tax=Protopolystoma xenopodis TaxID=117903 RepID=A0A448X658_9PLAT|nr:unnamed protein product [Protopolystoma xenopodis]
MCVFVWRVGGGTTADAGATGAAETTGTEDTRFAKSVALDQDHNRADLLSVHVAMSSDTRTRPDLQSRPIV